MDSATYLNSTEFDKNVERTMPFYGEFHRQTLELLAEMGHVHPRWLDAGCGTGLLIEKNNQVFSRCRFQGSRAVLTQLYSFGILCHKSLRNNGVGGRKRTVMLKTRHLAGLQEKGENEKILFIYMSRLLGL